MRWILLWLLLPGAEAGVTLREAAVHHQETILQVTDEAGEPRAGVTVRVVHRPGLRGERELAIGITDSRGTVRWTPQISGVARLRAADEVHAIRVEPTETPTHIVALLLTLCLAGLGGLGYGLAPSRRPRSPAAKPPP